MGVENSHKIYSRHNGLEVASSSKLCFLPVYQNNSPSTSVKITLNEDVSEGGFTLYWIVQL